MGQRYDLYLKQWREVDSLLKIQQTRSALEKAEAIYARAQKENNAPQIYKSLCVAAKARYLINDTTAVQELFTRFEAEIPKHKPPVKNMLQSVLASLYWAYYEQNRWKFLNRSATESFEPQNVETWDLRRLAEKVCRLYDASLENVAELKAANVADYDAHILSDVLNETHSRKVQPTCFDLLYRRAFDFFANEESGLAQPVYAFVLADDVGGHALFGPAQTFATINFSTRDSASFKWRAVRTIQALVAAHLDEPLPDALVHYELLRLKFVYDNAVRVENKKQQYLAALESLRTKYESWPAGMDAVYQEAALRNALADEYTPQNPTTEKYKNERKKALELCELALEKFPDSYGARNCKALKADILRPALALEAEKVVLPNEAFVASLSIRNVQKIYLRVVKIPDADLPQSQSAEERLDNYRSLTPAVADETISIPLPDDHLTHRIEIPVPALKKGLYAILVSTSPKFDENGHAVCALLTWVSTLSWHIDEAPTPHPRLRIADRKTGRPLENVDVTLFVNTWENDDYELKEIETQSSNAEGIVEFNKKFDRYRYETRLFRLKTDNDLLFLTGEAYYPYGYDKPTRPSPHLNHVFFTDRSIYRPGQTIYFKAVGVYWDGNKYVLDGAGKSYTFYLRDPNGNNVGQTTVQTNEFGSVQGTFTAPPTGTITGGFSIYSGHGTAYVSVEEYKRPKFETSFEPITESFSLGEEVKLTGKAVAYAGANVDGAKVVYRVTRKARYPYWRWWWMPWPTSEPMEIAHGETATDAEGRFSIRFKAVADESVAPETQPLFDYQITADVTDASGETRTGTTNVSVGYVALQVNFFLPERIETTKIPEMKATFSNLAGQKQTASGALHIRRVSDPERWVRNRYFPAPDLFLFSKDEFVRRFAYLPYAEEHLPQNRRLEAILHTQKFSGTECKFDFADKIKTWKPGEYVLTLETTDAFGKEVRVEKRFTLRATNGSAPPDALLKIEWVKASGEPGEKAILSVGAGESAHFFYVVEHEGKSIERQYFALNRETKTVEIPIREEWRGNFVVRYTLLGWNRIEMGEQIVSVPWTNKKLTLEFSTFRDKLSPGAEETWTITVKGPKGEAAAAEVLASMYDASLDAFKGHVWPGLPLKYNIYSSPNRFAAGYGYLGAMLWSKKWADDYPGYATPEFESLSDFGVTELFAYYRYRVFKKGERSRRMETAEVEFVAESKFKKGERSRRMETLAMPQEVEESDDAADGFADMENEDMGAAPTAEAPQKGKELSLQEKSASANGGAVKIRTDMRETAFFYPQLRTNEKGELSFSFTTPEALTRWKFMGFAHDKNLAFGALSDTAVTQKTLMVMPNMPRFLREGDKIVVAAKVVNLHDSPLSVTVELRLFDALTMKPIDDKLKNDAPLQTLQIAAGQSAGAYRQLEIPSGIQAVTWRITAKAGAFSDGEEASLPVVANRTLVTESISLSVRGKKTQHFMFKKLKENASATLKHHALTVEFTSNPAWYAVQALPYLMEYPYECSEQTFSRYYANAIAEHVVNSDPKIKQIFDVWKNYQPDALLSKLEKNQELKALLLEETPWVRDAKDESEQKRRIALLFDLNRMTMEKERALKKLQEAQTSSGGFVWFPGFREDAYMTRHIACGLMKLRALGVKTDERIVDDMVKNAVRFCDESMSNEYRELKRQYNSKIPEESFLNHHAIHYLYMRSFSNFFGISPEAEDKEMYEFWLGQCRKYWTTQNKYGQAMTALVLYRRALQTKKNEPVPALIFKALKENAIYSEELGTYWKDLTSGQYWWQAPIETMALLIEAFDEAAQDKTMTDGMKVWLLKNKQTNRWETTKATVEACYALLMRGCSLLSNNEPAKISLGGKAVEAATTEAGTGYFKVRYDGAEIKNDMGDIAVQSTNELVSWGAVYWQYFENLDKITSHSETGLKIVKQLFRQKNTDQGPVIEPLGENVELSPGDRVKVRIEIRADRDMEYVHLKDMRASGFEPVNVLSQTRYQDGLYYYESTRDAATNFFIDYLPKGTYVFEYSLRAFHRGDFSNGITTVQCMYAPEFTTHSQGVRVRVK